MLEYFEIKNNFIYPKQDLLIDSIESEFESNITFTPDYLKTLTTYNSNGKVLSKFSEGGIIILKYLFDKQPIMFRNTYMTEEVKDFRFKFCCEDGKECYLYKDKPAIEIINNIDNLFTETEVDFSEVNPFFEIEDNGFGKDIYIATPLVLKPKKHYEIKSGIKVHSKSKYLFLARCFWKYGLVIQPSLEISDDDNVIFKFYNAEDFEVTLGKDKDYSLLYNIFKLKEQS